MISVITVSYNTKEFLRSCLRNVIASERAAFEVIVVDNASKDGSVAMVKREFPEVICIENTENLGFGMACNQGMARAKGEYFFLLNSDTLIEKQTLAKLSVYMNEHMDVGVLGCQVRGANGEVQASAGFYPTIFRVFLWMSFLDDVGLGTIFKPYHVLDRRFFLKDQEVDWVQGSCMVITRPVYEKIGGFDEEIFMYGEDVEYGARAKKNSYRVQYIAGITITHFGQGSSEGKSRNALLGEFKGLKIMYRRHHTQLSQVLLSVMLQCGAFLRMLFFGILGGNKEARDTYAKAIRLA